jgi:glycerate 2-kinase
MSADTPPPHPPSASLSAATVAADDPARARDLFGVLQAALAAVDPEAAVIRTLTEHPPAGEKVTVLALGKAGPAMARGAARVLGARTGRTIVVSDHPENVPRGAELRVTSHPWPDSTSVAAGRLLLRAASESRHPILFLVSGGGSALAEVPAPGLDLDDLVAVYDTMLRTAVTIEETNIVRAHLSQIKGGRLAAAAATPTTTVLISDVGDHPDLIASGPTLPCRSLPSDALEVLERHSLTVPDSVREVLENAPPPPTVEPGPVIVAADGRSSAAAAADEAGRRGITARVVTTELAGEARDTALDSLDATPKGEVGVFAGETTVTVRGDGDGGRNQEAALAVSLAIRETGDVFVAFGTDGIDGPTDAAGAYVDGSTARRMQEAGIDAADALARNDSHRALEAAGALIRTGPTGVNVADLWLVDRRRPT